MDNMFGMTQSLLVLRGRVLSDELTMEDIQDTWDSIADAIEDKADGTAYIMAELDGYIDTIDKEIARLQERKASMKKRKEFLKDGIYNAMKALGRDKIKTATHSFSIGKNGGKRKLVLDVEAGMLPPYFREVQYKVNGDRLRESLEGADSNAWCHLEEAGEHLTIK